MNNSGEFSFNIDEANLEFLEELLRDNKPTKYQAKVVYPTGQEQIFNVNAIRIILKTQFKKCGKRYKRFIKLSNELRFEGVMNK